MAALSLTFGVQLNMRLNEVVFEIIAVLTRMYLQLHACEPHKNNHNVVGQHADNLELIYLSAQIHELAHAFKLTHMSMIPQPQLSVSWIYQYHLELS